MFKVRCLFILALLSASLIAAAATPSPNSVDEQIAAWEEVYASARLTPDFSWETTHVPALMGRIVFIADYVEKAVAGDAERNGRVRDIVALATAQVSSSRLCLIYAFRAFDALAQACDRTIPLESLDIELPISYIEEQVDGLSELAQFNVHVLCVRNGGLSLRRIVDGYLCNFPQLLVSLPDHTLAKGVHGGTCKKVVDFYRHDLEHASAFIRKYTTPSLQVFQPAYERIVKVRNSLLLESRERRIVDTYLFVSFHEGVNSLYEKSDYKTEAELTERIQTDIAAFDPFIDKTMAAALGVNTPLGSPIPVIGYRNGLLPATVSQSIARDLKISSSAGFSVTLTKTAGYSSDASIDDYLPGPGAGPELRVADTLVLRSFGVSPEGTPATEVPCTVIIEDPTQEMINITIEVNGNLYPYSAPVAGPQYFVNDLLGDASYWLKYAGYEDVPDPVTIRNYRTIPTLLHNLCTGAAQILKTKWSAMKSADF